MNRQFIIHLIIGITILYVGILARFYLSQLAEGHFYNYDITAYLYDIQLFREGSPIYASQSNYNYSPLFYYILGGIDTVNTIFFSKPLPVIIRQSLSLVDIASALIVYLLAKQRRYNPLKAMALFVLNPISIIITGYHGQFDNVAIFFFLVALFLSGHTHHKKWIRTLSVWIFATLSLIVKHIFIAQIALLFFAGTKKKLTALGLLLLCILGFAATFIPYYEFYPQIYKNVIMYTSNGATYGISYILEHTCGQCTIGHGINTQQLVRDIFIVSWILFSLKIRTSDIIRTCLLSTLFFLTFTTGISAQYFVFPVAFGALFPTKWFYLYSLVTTVFLLGNWDELNIQAFGFLGYEIVWIFVVCWFCAELLHISPKLQRVYKTIISQ